MAADWIKIQTNLGDKEEVALLGDILKIDRDMAVGKLFRVWSWADQNTKTGHGIRVTRKHIDEIARKRGFADALIEVGWLEGEDNCLIFPNFERHNGESAKKRAEDADRKRKSREGRDEPSCQQDQVSQNLPDKSVTREEKRREEYISVEAASVVTPAGALAKAARAAGIDCQPAQPQIVALVEQGIAVETLTAACEEAKRVKPGERIGIGYVVKILERWADDAKRIKVNGATPHGEEPKEWFDTKSGWIAKGAEIGEIFNEDDPRDPFPKFKARVAAKLGDGPWCKRL